VNLLLLEWLFLRLFICGIPQGLSSRYYKGYCHRFKRINQAVISKKCLAELEIPIRVLFRANFVTSFLLHLEFLIRDDKTCEGLRVRVRKTFYPEAHIKSFHFDDDMLCNV